jgi:hypothetical protein
MNPPDEFINTTINTTPSTDGIHRIVLDVYFRCDRPAAACAAGARPLRRGLAKEPEMLR